MTIQIPLKSLPCLHERFAKKTLNECQACSRYAGMDKARGVLYCGDVGANKWLEAVVFQAKWDMVKGD